MVKPNVSYVKETNEVHYNSRFATDFEPGNYYVDEANYLAYAYNDIKNTCFKDYTLDNSPSFYIEGNKCGTVVNRVTINGDIYDRDNYLGNISDYAFFNYLKKIIIMDGNPNGNIGKYIVISDSGMQTYNSMLYFQDNYLDEWGYCNYLAE